MNGRTRVVTRLGALAAVAGMLGSGGLAAHAAGSTPVGGPQSTLASPIPANAGTSGPSSTTVNAATISDGGLAGVSGAHFLYVDDSCPSTGSGTDIIYVYYVTSSGVSLVQAYQTPWAKNCYNGFFGVNTLGIVEANRNHNYCLAQTDVRYNDVINYYISPTSGQILGWASYAYTDTGTPTDVRTLGGGNYMAVTTSSAYSYSSSGVNIFYSGRNCALSVTGSQVAPAGRFYISGTWANSAHQFVEPDINTGALDVYSFSSPNGAITFQNTNSTFYNGNYPYASPDSAASDGAAVYVGDATLGNPCPDSGDLTYTGVYADQQQACDSSGADGASSWFDGFNYINGEQHTHSLGVYSGCCYGYAGPGGSFTFQQHTPLADTSSYVQDFQQSGTTLFVNDGEGNVDACLLAPNSVYGCTTILTYDASGYSDGMALL